VSDDDLIRREDAARIAEDFNLDIWEYSTGNRSRIAHDPVAEAIRALPAVTVQAQIDAAVKAERERCAKLCDAHVAALQEMTQQSTEMPAISPMLSGAIAGLKDFATSIRKEDQP
jgi:hypothetical protein